MNCRLTINKAEIMQLGWNFNHVLCKELKTIRYGMNLYFIINELQANNKQSRNHAAGMEFQSCTL